MLDSKVVYYNTTSNPTADIVRVTLLYLLLLSFCIFLYIATIMLHVFFTNPHIRENARYVLFAHMLINDTLLLFFSLFIYCAAFYIVYIPVPICYAVVTFSTCAFRITPYNLAAMSLERYLAICYPLRHAELCTAHRALGVIAFMWILGFIPQLIDFIALCYSVQRNFFLINMICQWSTFAMNQIQVTFRTLTIIISFTTVALVILYTYIKVMSVTRKVSFGRSALKAQKTVLLHAFQLFLCMSSFTSTFTEVYLKDSFLFINITNFFFFLCLPRFISPLIYGIRDEAFRKYIMKMKFSN